VLFRSLLCDGLAHPSLLELQVDAVGSPATGRRSLSRLLSSAAFAGTRRLRLARRSLEVLVDGLDDADLSVGVGRHRHEAELVPVPGREPQAAEGVLRVERLEFDGLEADGQAAHQPGLDLLPRRLDAILQRARLDDARELRPDRD